MKVIVTMTEKDGTVVYEHEAKGELAKELYKQFLDEEYGEDKPPSRSKNPVGLLNGCLVVGDIHQRHVAYRGVE